jgi:hypothetical protein
MGETQESSSTLNFQIKPGNLSHDNDESLNKARTLVSAQLEACREKILNDPEVTPVPPELEKVKEEIINYYKRELKQYGISISHENIELVQASDKLLGNNSGEIHRGTGLMIISDCGIPERPVEISDDDWELVLREKAVYMAHEIAHALIPMVVTTGKSVNEEMNLGSFRGGVSYCNESGQIIGNALEEARVEKWALKAQRIIDQTFPRAAERSREAVDEYKNMKTEKERLLAEMVKRFSGESYLRQKGQMSDNDIQREQITLQYMQLSGRTTEKGLLTLKSTLYLNGIELDRYLNSQIHDYDRLVERARFLGETGDLAVAVEERFGVGSYNKITSATVQTAPQILKEIKNQDPAKMVRPVDMVGN